MRVHKNTSKSIDTEKESEIERKMDSLMKSTKELVHETNREMVAELTKKFATMAAASIFPAKVAREPVNEFGSIYLLQEREFMHKNQDVYKVGMTSKPHLSRFNSYPKGSKLIYHNECLNFVIAEKIILANFREQFIPMTNIGSEYFKGDRLDMIDIIHHEVMTMNRKAKTQDMV